MHRLLLLGAALAAALCAQTAAVKPKLVLVITVDQFRYDYLTRFQSSYNAGLARLWKQGAVFTDAHYEHFPTVTAIGHAAILSGATPSVAGIVGNEWYDRELQKQVTSVEDPAHKLVGAEGVGASPRNLMVSTIGDELKMSGKGAPKVIGISIKDRSAILPVGRMADSALWFHNGTGNFVSSTYYGTQLPSWASGFNESREADKFTGAAWSPIDDPNGEPFEAMEPKPGAKYWSAMQRTPFGNELLWMLASRAIEAEKLGQRDATDLLSISFSSNDYVGHDHGPDSPRVRDISIRTDRILGQLFDFIAARVGMENVLVVLTADHGVAPLPEKMQERKIPAGRLPPETVRARVQARLAELYGEGTWLLGYSGPAPFLNYALIAAKKLDPVEVRLRAAEAVRAMPHIFRVYTHDQLATGRLLDDQVDRRVRNGFYAARSSDLFIVPQPYWVFETKGTSHGTPFHYDSHVPVIFMGPGIRPGKYARRAAVNDIAPTLAALLEIEAPSGSAGRVLDEAVSIP